jgi:hypothetical protein
VKILNKQSRRDEKGWSCSFLVESGMTWAGHAARQADKKSAIRLGYLLVGKLEGKKQLGIQRRDWIILRRMVER